MHTLLWGSLEFLPRVWTTGGLARARSGGMGGHGAEPTKHLLESHCRALLSQKASTPSSPALQQGLRQAEGHLPCCPVTFWGGLGAGVQAQQWAGKGNGCSGSYLVLGSCTLVHRADRFYSSRCVPACTGSSAVVRWLPASAFHCGAVGSASGCFPGQGAPYALSLQALQTAWPWGPPAAMHPMSGWAGQLPGAMPTAVPHLLGFGICDCSNYLLQ